MFLVLLNSELFHNGRYNMVVPTTSKLKWFVGFELGEKKHLYDILNVDQTAFFLFSLISALGFYR